ncbi:unnamed protein product [Pedinophyceae sp. YPF-701]|nr:unnamed protein product [Pedinophyceae sp. YPF-701]
MHADVPAMQVMQRLRGLERLRVWGAVLALKGWNAIGERVSIYYPSERKWFMGVVSDFVAETWQHQIIFDDGDVEVCRLGIDRWARKPAAADIPLEGGEGREGALWFDQEFGTGRAPGEDLDTLKQVTGTFGAHAFAAGLQQAAATASLVPGASQANLEMWTKGLGLCKVRIVAWKRALGSSHGGWVNKPPDTFLVRVPYTDGTYNDMHLDLDKHVLYIPGARAPTYGSKHA